MTEYVFHHETPAPPEVVWGVIADNRGIVGWTQIRKAELEVEGTPPPDGVGAIRKLSLVGPPIREKVVAFEPGTLFAYEMLSGLPVSDYRAECRLEPSGAGTKITYSVRFRPKVPGLQFVIKFVVGDLAKRLAKESARRAGTA